MHERQHTDAPPRVVLDRPARKLITQTSRRCGARGRSSSWVAAPSV